MFTFICIYFTANDPSGRGINHHERDALAFIAKSPDSVVEVHEYNNIMAWGRIADSSGSKANGQLLHYWNIFPQLKYYYQK